MVSSRRVVSPSSSRHIRGPASGQDAITVRFGRGLNRSSRPGGRQSTGHPEAPLAGCEEPSLVGRAHPGRRAWLAAAGQPVDGSRPCRSGGDRPSLRGSPAVARAARPSRRTAPGGGDSRTPSDGGRSPSTLEPRPALQRLSGGPLAGGPVRAGNREAEPGPPPGLALLGTPRSRCSRGLCEHVISTRRRETVTSAACRGHGHRLRRPRPPAEPKAPSSESATAATPRPLGAQPRIVRARQAYRREGEQVDQQR